VPPIIASLVADGVYLLLQLEASRCPAAAVTLAAVVLLAAAAIALMTVAQKKADLLEYQPPLVACLDAPRSSRCYSVGADG
jgi:hypothetical protein